MPNAFTLSSIGTRGLVIYDDKDTYNYVTEEAWRARGPLNPIPPTFPARNLIGLNVAVAALDEGVYVDLERMPDLEPASVPNPNANPVPWVADPRSVVIREKDAFYQIVEADWQQVPEGFEGDAGVLVKRGAVVATIPSNSIPSGTYCILVNLANLAK
jgi:hypothetical protein